MKIPLVASAVPTTGAKTHKRCSATTLGRLVASLLGVALLSPNAYATQFDSVLATRGDRKATTEDFYALHFRQPPKKIEGLRESPKEIESSINEILAPRTYTSRPDLQLQLTPEEARFNVLMLERAPLDAALDITERRVRAAFGSEEKKNLERAKEIWLIDETEYSTPETADFTQIFFDMSRRSFSEIQARIEAAQNELRAGTSFDEVVQKFSDDANVKTNKGTIMGLEYGRTDPVIGKEIFQRLKVGEISAPVPSRIGLHLVRLDKKKPRGKKAFEDAKTQILSKMMDQQVKAARIALLERLNAVETVYSQDAIEAFLIKPDAELQRRAKELHDRLNSGAPGKP